MRLLIVVDKLLTGFDAPPATYLYIDKKMRDHGLFQAICRVNRLDGDDKDYGYIVDYHDLFNSLESAITDYTSGALDGYEKEDIEGLLTDRIEKAREDLDEALEKIRALCEPVAPPKDTLQYQHYFCAARAGQRRAAQGQRAEARRALQGGRRRRRAPTRNLANEMAAAGYSDAEADAIKAEIAHYAAVRDEVEARRRRGRRLQAVRGRHALPARHLHPGRRLRDRRRLRGHRADRADRRARRRRDRQAARRASRRTPRPSPRRSPTTCAR